MSAPVLVVGPLAYDDVRTATAQRSRVLGGSAAYASIAAAKHGPTLLVSVCGADLRDDDLAVLRTANVDLGGLTVRDGRTLRWSGTYSDAFALSVVRNTDLGVVRGWRPVIPTAARDAAFVFLTNTEPEIQAHALDQIHPAVVLLDTMDEWIVDHRPAFERILARATVLSVNERELRLITGADDLAKATVAVLGRGPRAVLLKRGPRGASLITAGGTYALPAHPAAIVDPTGAGDALGGAFLGHLSRSGRRGEAGYRDALAAGVAAASLAAGSFGVDALARASLADLDERARTVAGTTGEAAS